MCVGGRVGQVTGGQCQSPRERGSPRVAFASAKVTAQRYRISSNGVQPTDSPCVARAPSPARTSAATALSTGCCSHVCRWAGCSAPGARSRRSSLLHKPSAVGLVHSSHPLTSPWPAQSTRPAGFTGPCVGSPAPIGALARAVDVTLATQQGSEELGAKPVTQLFTVVCELGLPFQHGAAIPLGQAATEQRSDQMRLQDTDFSVIPRTGTNLVSLSLPANRCRSISWENSREVGHTSHPACWRVRKPANKTTLEAVHEYAHYKIQPMKKCTK